MLSILVIWLVAGAAIFVGLVVFANYWACDPKLTRTIDKKDELVKENIFAFLTVRSFGNSPMYYSHSQVTLFVLDHLIDFYGIPGIFIASLLSGALRYNLINNWRSLEKMKKNIFSAQCLQD